MDQNPNKLKNNGPNFQMRMDKNQRAIPKNFLALCDKNELKNRHDKNISSPHPYDSSCYSNSSRAGEEEREVTTFVTF